MTRNAATLEEAERLLRILAHWTGDPVERLQALFRDAFGGGRLLVGWKAIAEAMGYHPDHLRKMAQRDQELIRIIRKRGGRPEAFADDLERWTGQHVVKKQVLAGG